MRKLKLFFACLLMAVLSIGQVWGAVEFVPSDFSGQGTSSTGSAMTQTKDGVTVSTDKGFGTTEIRVYSGGKFTIESSSTITALAFTFSGGKTGGLSASYSNLSTNKWEQTLSSQARFSKIEVTISSGGGDNPTVSVTPNSLAFGSVEQNASVAAKTFSVTGSNLTGAISIAAPTGYTVSLTSITPSTGSIAATNVTVTPSTANIGSFNGNVTISGGGLTSNVTVGLTMTVTEPFNGEVLEIKNTDFATSYTNANGDHDLGCVTITSNQVGNYSSSIQFQKNAGYIYNKTPLGEIAKIEITKTGNNNLVVYEGTAQNPTSTSITGVAVDNITTYTFSSGKSYFRIFCNNTGASNVTPIKVYYHPASYEVTLSAGSNGSLSATVDAAAIASGDEVEMCKTVTIAATPNEGYKIKSLTVTDEDDDEVEVTSNQFVMPAKAVTVAATFEATKTLSSITLSGTQRTSFWVGETFSSTGLVVTAHYDDESSATVTPASISSPDMSTAGEKTITVTYTEGTTKSNTYTINVKALPTTQGTAGTVADLIDIYDKLGNQSNLYIKGTIYKINGFYSEKYISYWITDSYDGEANPNHSNEFELYNGLDFDGADFTAATDLEVGQYVIVKGNLTKYSSTYEFATGNEIVSRPKVLKGIALSGSYPTEFTQGDEFSSVGLVVTASYNYGEDATVTPTSISGYDMSATGNQTVTVSYTEADVTKTATYDISIAAPDLCEHKATISKGAEVNGTFSLSVSGEQCLDELEGYKTSTVLTATPAEHYHLSEVTATVGTVGTIADNECTISDIDASTTITAVFVENDKVTVKFAKGTESATGDVPADVANKYAGQSVTLPANPFTYTGEPLKVFGGWKHSLTNEVKQPGSYTITAADAAEDNITFTAVWNDLSPWATVYTSNVTLSTTGGTSASAAEVKFYGEEGDGYDAIKAGTGSVQGAVVVNVPAGATALHLHAYGWKGEALTLSITAPTGVTVTPSSITLNSNDGITSNSPFTLTEGSTPQTDAYYALTLSGNTAAADLTFTATSGKRFVLFGVNQEGAVTLESISVSGTATALEYNDGDHFNPAGLGVTGHYSDASTAPITEGVVWAFDPDPLTEGTTSVSVTATAGGFTSDPFVVDGLTVAGAAPLSPWATTYTSNITLSVDENDTKAYAEKVKITVEEELTEFSALRAATGSAAGECHVIVPAGTQTLHFHAAAWNGKASTVTVKMGETTLLEQALTSDAGIANSSPYTLSGNAYEYYYSIDLSGYSLAEETRITFSVGSDKRFVLFGVNQEGGIVPVLDHIEIGGTMTNTTGWKTGDKIIPEGLTVTAYYTQNDAPHHHTEVTDDVTWSHAALVENQTEVTLTASYTDGVEKTANTNVTIDPVELGDPTITTDPAAQATFTATERGAASPAAKTIAVTLKNIASATATLGGTNPEVFSLSKTTGIVDGDVISVSVVSTDIEVASYSATVTIKDANGDTQKSINIYLTINEPVIVETPVSTSTKWVPATEIKDGMEVLITGVKDEVTYAMGGQNKNNRAAVVASIDGDGVLAPGANTMSFIVVDQNNETFALRTSDGKYLYAASSGDNYLRTQAAVDVNAKWTLTLTSAVAESSSNRNVMQFNSGSSIFSCYASASQSSIKLYVRKPDYERNVTEGRIGTICLPKAGKMEGASLFQISYMDYEGDGVTPHKIYFDELPSNEMIAGRPYIFLPNEGATKMGVYYDNPATGAEAEAGHLNGLYGTLTEMNTANSTGDDLWNNFIFSNNLFYLVNSSTVRLQANRAYVKACDELPGWSNPGYVPSLPAPGLRRIGIGGEAPQVTTGMENVQTDDAQTTKVLINGQFFILRGEKMYDATGRLVK